MFVDVHAHLDLCSDVDSILMRARDVVVINNGLGPKNNKKILEISEKSDNVFPALGLYPSESLKMNDKQIEEEISFILEKKEVLAGIGETGLDFSYMDNIKQEKVFEKMIDVSLKLDIPIIVHSRKAEERAVEILENKNAKKVVMHCFNGKLKLIRKICDNGWMLSIPLTIVRNKHFQRVVEEFPLDNILTETDCPYLGMGEENEPSNVKLTVEKIAAIKKLNKKIVERKIFSNFEKLFSHIKVVNSK